MSRLSKEGKFLAKGDSVVKILVALLLVCALDVAAASIAVAIDLKSGDSIEYPEGRNVSQDILAAGNKVVVNSSVAGDVTAAGRSVSVAGSVKNSVMLAGRTVTVSGRVGNDAWMAGEKVTLAGPVADNAYMAGADVVCGKKGSVGGDLMATGKSATVAGRVGKNLRIAGNELIISGMVNDSVYARGDRLRLLDGAVIRGDLNYESPHNVTIAPGARVLGEVRHTLPQREKAKPFFWTALVFWIGSLLAQVVFGIAFLLLFPTGADAAADTVRARFWLSLGIGLLILIATPIACAILAVTLIGIPLAIAVFLIYIVLLMAAGIVVALALGWWLLGLRQLRNVSSIIAMILGIIVLKLLWLIPYFGALLRLVVVVTGLGAILMNWWRGRGRRAEPQAASSL